MTHWRINGLRMFEKIKGFRFKAVLIQLSETRIRPSPDVPLRLFLPLLSQPMVTVLPTRWRPRVKHQAPLPPDVTAMIPKLQKPKVTSHAPLILKPLATRGTFRCDFKGDESSCYQPPRADRRKTKGISPLRHWGATRGVACSDCYHPQGRRAVAADKRHKMGEEPLDVDGDVL
jgi:hypothetical protein